MINPSKLFKLYSRFRVKKIYQQNFPELQKRQLSMLLNKAQSTRFGNDYKFNRLKTVEDYQKSVPLRTYTDFCNDYWENFPHLSNCTWPGKIKFFSVTSGNTTGQSKYIPLTREMIRFSSRGTFDLFCFHFFNHPQSNIFAGKGFMLNSLIGVKEIADNIFSATFPALIFFKNLPFWARPWHYPPLKILGKDNYDELLQDLARYSVREDIRSLSGFPSLLLTFFSKLKNTNPDAQEFRIGDYYPNLELIVCGGVSFTPYVQQFSYYTKDVDCDIREIYPGSEGFIAIADRGQGQGLLLNCEHGIFYEFVRWDEFHQDNPTRYWLGNVEVGVDYAIILTTAAGLWGYILGDVVKFVDLDPPRIVVTGRTTGTLSIYGEMLNEEEVCCAVAAAAEKIGSILVEFSVGPYCPENLTDNGRHIYIVEFLEQPAPNDLLVFKKEIDLLLKESSYCYIHSRNGYGLMAPDVVTAPPGTFKRWLDKMEREKVTRIFFETDQFNEFFEFVKTSN